MTGNAQSAAEEAASDPEETREELAERVLSRLPARRPASLYDVAVQYGLLDWLDSRTSEAIDWDIDPTHLSFMTPRAKSGLFGESDSLIVVWVDLSDPDEPRLTSHHDRGPVSIETMREDLRFRVGHAYPANKTSSMTDYSITTHKSADAHHLAGRREDAWGTNNVQDRFSGWAQSEAAQRVIEEDGVDSWLIEALAALGNDDEAMSTLEEAFIREAGDEDEEFEALITVRIKLPDSDEFRFPGEIPALNEVMAEQKAERLANISVEDAEGQGVGYVEGTEGKVTGGSSGLFGAYGKKQREHFPDLSVSGEEAWRSRPITQETAAALATADSLFDAFYSGLGESRRLYFLPYLASPPSELEPEDVTWFFDEVYDRLREADGETFQRAVRECFQSMGVAGAEAGEPETATEDPFAHLELEEEHDAWDAVRFAAVMQVSGNPDRVFFDTLSAATYRPADLENAHNTVVTEGPFARGGVFHGQAYDNSLLVGRELDLQRLALFGTYFVITTEPTRSSEESDDPPRTGDIDDTRIRRLRRFLTGDTISVWPLLEGYLHKIVQEQRGMFGDESVGVPFPTTTVLEQYAQLRALRAADILDTADAAFAAEFTYNQPTTTTSTSTMSQGPREEQSREQRLDDFLENHGVLAGDRRRQAVFLLGSLVGRITAFQRNPEMDVSSTLVRRYPVDYLTKQTIKEVTKEVLQTRQDYIQAENLSGQWNARYTNRLPGAMLESDPSEWSIRRDELQWLYSLGIAYGLSDTSSYEPDGSETDE